MLNTAVESLCWKFEKQALNDPDLIDKLTLSLCDNTGISYPDFRLHLLLSELITNAIDHGVLNLDSNLKESDSGFQKYSVQRAKRLDALESGWISVNAEWVSAELLRISVQDNGEGFDYESIANNEIDEHCLHGRGLLIVKSLCTSVVHIGSGNCIVVEFQPEPTPIVNAALSADCS